MEERSYETASLGETSADELVLKSSSDFSDTEIDIYKTDEIAANYQRAQKLSNAVKDYESELVQEHLSLDLYRAKGKTKNKISFNDMTLEENLNYIKYTLKDSDEAFKLFEITRDTFGSLTPEIPAALVQKIATKTKDIDRKGEVRDKIVRRPQYKQMLRQIKEKVGELDNRQLVDTLYSVGKLHQKKLGAEIAEEAKLFPFMYHFVAEFLEEVTDRVDQLDPQEIAYLLKGLTNLHDIVTSDPNAEEKEQKFRQQLLAHLNLDHAKVSTFDPYTVSKVLRYLLKYNDGGVEAQEIFKSFSLLLTQTVVNREAALVKSDLKDPLIDLEAHDVVDIVRIYATFAQDDDSLVPSFVPKLFKQKEGDVGQAESNVIKEATSRSLATQDDSSPQSLQLMSIQLLQTLQKPLLHKLESASIANISDLLFAYSTASPDMLQSKD